MSGVNTQLLGRWGEDRAAEYLRKQGYTIVSMGYRTRFGEIDIIAKDKYCVVFVEVKLRKSDKFAQAMEYVDPQKQVRIITCAGLWITKHESDLQPRFDVIEVYAPDGIRTMQPKINHIKNAFSGSIYADE